MKVSVIIDAIEKNGYPKLKGTYFNGLGGCAIGQAARNLKLPPVEVHYRLPYGDTVVDWNDHTELTLPQIAQLYRKKFSTLLNTEV